MAKEVVEENIALIKKSVGTNSLVIGTDRTLKTLKSGKIDIVFLSSNCPEDVEKAVQHYCKLSSTKVSKINYPNDELGVLCKKPFSISVIGIVKSK